jgi:2-C-methyl-D-erythritol 4-phosphate cytidylyltransferase
MSVAEKVWAVVPAAGIGSRFGGELPKQYVLVNGKPIIGYTLDVLLAHESIDRVFVAIKAEDMQWLKTDYIDNPQITTVTGGDTRLQSVFNGLLALNDCASPNDWVMVHDAVRPVLTQELIDKLLMMLAEHTVGGLLGVPAVDTVKSVNTQGDVLETLPRESIWRAQTPQLFRYEVLFNALKKAVAEGYQVTDESSAVECLGLSPKMVMGAYSNSKITTPEDLFLFSSRLRQE